MKVLITGINGFAGSFLAEALLRRENDVFGIVQPGTENTNIEHIIDSVSLYKTDILDSSSVNEVINTVRPELIFHLAGASSVKESFIHPQVCFNVNVNGGLNIIEAMKDSCPESVFLLVTSGEIYGESLSVDRITKESSSILPKSPYAVSKAAIDMLGRIYVKAYESNIIIARPFSHIGPRQSDIFFVSSVARQIAEIEQGSRATEICVGNIEIYRDFTDVRDVAEAYVLLAQKVRKGEVYNVCSGQRYLLRNVIDILLGLSKEKKISIKVDANRLRAVDLLDMHVDNTKIKEATGWCPKFSLERSLEDSLNFWRNKILRN